MWESGRRGNGSMEVREEYLGTGEADDHRGKKTGNLEKCNACREVKGNLAW